VHEWPVQAQPDSLSGQWGADLNAVPAECDDAVGRAVRSTSTAVVVAKRPGQRRAGGAPAGRASALRSRARSTADKRDDTVLIRDPSIDRCTVVVSIHKVTVWPTRCSPSQNCCGPTVTRSRPFSVRLRT
jgi:hypothetical protein